MAERVAPRSTFSHFPFAVRALLLEVIRWNHSLRLRFCWKSFQILFQTISQQFATHTRISLGLSVSLRLSKWFEWKLSTGKETDQMMRPNLRLLNRLDRFVSEIGPGRWSDGPQALRLSNGYYLIDTIHSLNDALRPFDVMSPKCIRRIRIYFGQKAVHSISRAFAFSKLPNWKFPNFDSLDHKCTNKNAKLLKKRVDEKMPKFEAFKRLRLIRYHSA